jgi:hypothetical protein
MLVVGREVPFLCQRLKEVGYRVDFIKKKVFGFRWERTIYYPDRV